MKKRALLLLSLLVAIAMSITAEKVGRRMIVNQGGKEVASYLLPANLDSLTFKVVKFFDVSCIADDPANGSVTASSNEVEQDSTVTLTAIPNAGGKFVNWTVNGEEVSKELIYTITITSDIEYVANFAPLHKVTVLAGEGGTVKTSKTQVEHNGQVTLTATPAQGYEFVNWSVNGEVVSTENPYKATITQNTQYIATFEMSNIENGHEFVDLGLPSGLKWATCNVGATSPEEYGDYFAWGETEPKDNYSWSTYKYCNGSNRTLTKYCVDSSYGTVDNKTVLELEDDAAHVNWGGNWRMPTRAEQDELRNTNNCTWEWTTQNGVKGYKVTSVVNGNSIFLPAAGCRYNYYLSDAGGSGSYWSSSLLTSFSEYACYVYFYSSGVDLYFNNCRYYGHSVRAVCSEPKPTYIVTVSLDNTMGTVEISATEVEEGATVTLTATPAQGYNFVNWTVNGEVVSTKNPYTVTVTSDIEYVANFEEFTSLEGWYRIKEVTTGKYLNAEYYTSHTSGPTGGVNLADYSEDGDQIFMFVQSGANYMLKTRSSYNIVCQTYNVDALKSEGTELDITETTYNGQLAIKINLAYPNSSQRDGAFKVEEVSGTYYPFCDASNSDIATWVLEKVSFDPEQKYNISVSATEGGIVEASATEAEMYTTVTIRAIPADGYRFVNWTLNGEVVSTQNTYTVMVLGDTECIAHFEEFTHEYVDLGLPSGIKWATCNVGATTPEEYGDYFAWGETEPKDNYSWDSYKYCNGSSNTMIKYCTSSGYGTVDNKTVLELEDDAAHVNWGGNWRMPTKAEQDELRNTNNCTWEWTTQNGVNGYKVTSVVNGNSIFLPAAGGRYGGNLGYAGSDGNYWSSSLYTSGNYGAYYVGFESSYVDWIDFNRYCGRSVRAVCP